MSAPHSASVGTVGCLVALQVPVKVRRPHVPSIESPLPSIVPSKVTGPAAVAKPNWTVLPVTATVTSPEIAAS